MWVFNVSRCGDLLILGRPKVEQWLVGHWNTPESPPNYPGPYSRVHRALKRSVWDAAPRHARARASNGHSPEETSAASVHHLENRMALDRTWISSTSRSTQTSN